MEQGPDELGSTEEGRAEKLDELTNQPMDELEPDDDDEGDDANKTGG